MKKQLMPDREAAHIIVQLLSLLAYLHEKNVMLQGLRLNNVMLEEGTLLDKRHFSVSVIDFNETIGFTPGENVGMEDWELDPENAIFIAPEVHAAG
jgi:serine/threonine protein kinase